MVVCQVLDLHLTWLRSAFSHIFFFPPFKARSSMAPAKSPTFTDGPRLNKRLCRLIPCANIIAGRMIWASKPGWSLLNPKSSFSTWPYYWSVKCCWFRSMFSYPNAPILLHKPERFSLIPLNGSTATIYEPERFLAYLLEDLRCGKSIVQAHSSSDITIRHVGLA